ncbi:hypothetical protein QBC35DRAFT_247477 [Podospora australis]|uniref:Mid2 domain-containing protein n=1 Tax=Podospora australis TaxID=1536484 RepID=A0AAN6X6Q5_9PEZI|nr:hypothetical protein QBC35DRAFT_247477 [Podospora australis]
MIQQTWNGALVREAMPGRRGQENVQEEPNIQRRIPFPDEHVVLADCRDSNNVRSSQMAYFQGTPGPKPEDVAVVKTNPGQTALWINADTSGLFTTTKVTFTATIGPKVDEGEFAGTGKNGFEPDFSCYQQLQANLYVYDGTTCSQVYYCNHSEPTASRPSPGPSPSASGSGSGSGSGSASSSAPSSGSVSTSSSVSASSSAAASGLPSATPPLSSSDNSLSQGTLIAVIVGVVGAVMFAASIIALIWFCRRSRKRPSSAVEMPGDSQHELAASNANGTGYTSSAYAPSPGPESKELSYPPKIPAEMPTVNTVFEVDGQWYRYEMPTTNDRYELDGRGRFELDPTSRHQAGGQGACSVSPPVTLARPDSSVLN